MKKIMFTLVAALLMLNVYAAGHYYARAVSNAEDLRKVLEERNGAYITADFPDNDHPAELFRLQTDIIGKASELCRPLVYQHYNMSYPVYSLATVYNYELSLPRLGINKKILDLNGHKIEILYDIDNLENPNNTVFSVFDIRAIDFSVIDSKSGGYIQCTSIQENKDVRAICALYTEFPTNMDISTPLAATTQWQGITDNCYSIYSENCYEGFVAFINLRDGAAIDRLRCTDLTHWYIDRVDINYGMEVFKRTFECVEDCDKPYYVGKETIEEWASPRFL